MSECKHERITCVGHVNILRCDDCGHEEPNIDELQLWIKNLQGNIEELSIEKFSLQAQAAVLRGALEEAEKTIGYCSHCRTDNRFTRLRRRLLSLIQDTPAEAAECVQRLVTALEEIQKSGTGWDDDGSVVRTYEAMLAASALSDWRRQS